GLDVVADEATGLGADIDKGHMRSPARQGLEPQRAGAGEEVKHALALEHRPETRAENVEHAFAHPICRGTNAVVRRRDQLLAAKLSRNNAHGLAPRLARTRGTGATRGTSATTRGTCTALGTTATGGTAIARGARATGGTGCTSRTGAWRRATATTSGTTAAERTAATLWATITRGTTAKGLVAARLALERTTATRLAA